MASEDIFRESEDPMAVDEHDEEPPAEDPTEEELEQTILENDDDEVILPTQETGEGEKSKVVKLIKLPLTRIKNLMKLDPDYNGASQEAVASVAVATEYFIQSLAREAYTFTQQVKKKTLQKNDVDCAINAVDSLMFLKGAMNFGIIDEGK
ncbi:POLE4 family protein [Megaselia abdita]